MISHISEISLKLTFWAWGFSHFASILSLNPLHSGHKASIVLLASALPKCLLLCPHPLQLWQVMAPRDWRIPASKTCRPLPGPAISFHHLRRREWNQNQAKSKGCAEPKSLILSFFFFFFNTKLSDPECPWLKINLKIRLSSLCYLRTFYYMQLHLLF